MLDRVIVVKGLEQLKNETGKGGVAVVDFWATWCKPCKDVAPKYSELSLKYGDVRFLKGDIADFEEDDLVDMGLLKIPSFFVYKDVKKVKEFVGNECCEEEHWPVRCFST